VRLAPSALDDASQLQALALAPWPRIFELDRFGHWRPIKSALFWALAHHSTWLWLCRCGLLAAVIASGRLLQAVCTPLLDSAAWARGVALLWLLHPVTASVLCWLSTANLVLCLLGLLGYVLLLTHRSGVGPIVTGVRDGASRPEPPRRAQAAAVGCMVCLVVALLSHELAVLAPVLGYAYQRVRRVGHTGPARAHVMKLLAASVACCVAWLALLLSHTVGAAAYRSAETPRMLLVLQAPQRMFENLWLWFCPKFGVLSIEQTAAHGGAVALWWFALFVVLIGATQMARRDAVAAFALLWIGLLLAPLLNFIPLGNTLVALHYLYLPGAGLALLMARAAQRLRAHSMPRGVLVSPPSAEAQQIARKSVSPRVGFEPSPPPAEPLPCEQETVSPCVEFKPFASRATAQHGAQENPTPRAGLEPTTPRAAAEQGAQENPSLRINLEPSPPRHDLALLMTRDASQLRAPRGRLSSAGWLPALALAVWCALCLPEQRRVLAAWADPGTLYATTIANYPRNIEARVNLIAVQLDARLYDEAAVLIDDSLRIAPTDPGLLVQRMQLFLDTDRPGETVAVYDAHPDLKLPAAQLLRAHALVALGRDPEALAAYRSAFDAAVPRDEHCSAGYKLAIALVRAMQPMAASELIAGLIRECPDRPELRYAQTLLRGVAP
jgi:hypothetical protein